MQSPKQLLLRYSTICTRVSILKILINYLFRVRRLFCILTGSHNKFIIIITITININIIIIWPVKQAKHQNSETNKG
ncbi:unnamed protein product [Phytomonas sp. EM1]|nr:unnamed protein product [Phytomonas sp. EM1]|eukprot:CCW60064.1 unnamed protein product [Phytomonas sp. isolate EM1]